MKDEEVKKLNNGWTFWLSNWLTYIEMTQEKFDLMNQNEIGNAISFFLIAFSGTVLHDLNLENA